MNHDGIGRGILLYCNWTCNSEIVRHCRVQDSLSKQPVQTVEIQAQEENETDSDHIVS